ncbi:streptophobe family protein [Streptomyces olindensis]|uniref:streptophobe family protein n=1 Tax=Streptomyces olindensis TaxID=358823 RepID=UPI0033E334EF
MGGATGFDGARGDARVPWGDVLMSAVAAVSWALIGMAGTAALGLRLLEADAAGSLGPMTAAVVALAAGGSVTPSGDVSAFGLTSAEADTAIEITPLGVSLVGAVLLSYFFLRSLRAAGVVISPAELLARVGALVALFVAMLGGLAWAGHDVITIDGGALGLDDVTGGGGGVEVPGLGDIGGLLPDRLGDLVDAQASVGFTVDTAPTLLGGFLWSAGILAIALLASRRTPLPRGWEAVHRVVRPAVSAVVTVLLVAVAAGLAAAGYAAIGDDHPRRIAGAALLGAPNGVWLGIPIGLLVPWDGRATGELTRFLPDPLDDLLAVGTDQPVTLGRLAELDGRVWLLGVAAALTMLLAGVLMAARTPVPVGGDGAGAVGSGVEAGWGAVGRGAVAGHGSVGWSVQVGSTGGSGGSAGIGDSRGSGGFGNSGGVGGSKGFGSALGVRGSGALGFAGWCALRLGIATALALPLLAWLTEVSATASLSVLGFDAFGAGIELHGHLGMALLLGAVWGAGAGAVGALLAWASGAAGRAAAPLAREGGVSGAEWPSGVGGVGIAGGAGIAGGEAGRAGGKAGRAGGVGGLGGAGQTGGATAGPGVGWPGQAGPGTPRPDTGQARPGAPAGPAGHGVGAGPAQDPGRGRTGSPPPPHGGEPGPYAPGAPYRPPNPATNPYLRVPEELREPEDARPPGDAARHDRPPRPGGRPHRPRQPGTPRPGEPRPSHDARSGGDLGREGDSPREENSATTASSPAANDSTRHDDSPRANDSAEHGDSPEAGDLYGAPTVARPVGPPPRRPRQPPGPRGGNGPPARPDDGPPPPPPPPPPRKPRGGR